MSDIIERIVAAGRSYGISCSILGEDHCCSKATEEYLRHEIATLVEARVAEAVSPSEEVEETAVEFGCAYVDGTGRECHGLPFDEVHTCRKGGNHHPHMPCHPFEPRPTPSSPSEPTVEESESPFRRAVRETSGVNCGCMCHTGVGYNTVCDHCQYAPVEEDRKPVAAAPVEPLEGEWTPERVRAFNGDLGATPSSVLRESTRLLSSAMAENRRLMGEVERLQARLADVRPLLQSCSFVEPECDDCEPYYTYDPTTYARAQSAVLQAEARVSTPVREERGE